ncbi:MAG TPA: PAS domain-containing sensor histidine kinase [Candidatus Thermoplasmatota archaeon]|nr:PAS domain-containing sensor histidine kinase [Candidatus Thermoplasmatota archaeon]
MNTDDPEIIKTLREEERLGKLHKNASAEQRVALPEEKEEDSLESIFTILRHHHQEDVPTIDLGDPIQKYRIIFENSAIAIMLTDENERIVHWNKYTEKLLGMGKEDLMMKPVKYLYPQEEWKKIRSENIRQKGIQHHLETKMIRKNNELIDVDISLSVLKDHIGNVIGSIGIIKDNSPHKQMERTLRISEEKFKQLYEKAPIPYHTLSPDGRITDVNDTWCRLFGYAKADVIGTPIFDYIQCDEQDTAKSSFKEKIHKKKPYTGKHERTYMTKNGEPRVFVINDFLCFDESGAVLSVYSTMEDITERKKIEEELHKAHYWLEKKVQERTVELSKQNTLLKKRINEYKRTVGELHFELEKHQRTQKRIEKQNVKLKKLDQIKSNFLHITTHELRTSMATMRGYVEILLMKSLGPINEEQRKGLEVILTNTNRLDKLIQDVLDVSCLESGTMKFNPERINVKKLIEDVIGAMQPVADNKQIKISKEITQGIPELNVDKGRIKQVLINLLNNAIQSSPENSTIILRVSKEPDDVVFEIQDFGRGIPKNKQKKIFDIVYQVDPGMNRTFREIGLGFTISRGIVLAHGGKIWVESENEKGNILRFTLPNKSIQQGERKFREVDVIPE